MGNSERGIRLRRRGFTLLEVMVVTAISLMLVGVSTFIYMNCLKIYKDSQGITGVYETAKLVNRDMRDFLNNIVPMRGQWVTPQCILMPGQPNTDDSKVNWYFTGWYNRGPYYANSNAGGYDSLFSGPQDTRSGYIDWQHVGAWRGGWDPAGWSAMMNWVYPYMPGSVANLKDWWLPGFYGKRNGVDPAVLKDSDILVGSWGWPRPDYRLDADADKIASGGASLASGGNVACWFYAEERNFNSPYTLSLDNNNIVLASLKFSVRQVDNHEETQLSFLRHHMCGFDHSYKGGTGLMRADQSFGNMLRAIKITPCYLNASGVMLPMDDGELGCTLAGTTVAGGTQVPRCFDIAYTLRNPSTLQAYQFALRVYCRSNPQ